MTTAATDVHEIKIAHSPDSDDAFMFYGLATNKIRVPGYKFTHTLTDIEALNHRALTDQFYDVTAISFHAYPYLQDNYALMACGGSVGDGYGPMVVAAKPYTLDEMKKLRIAVPGTLTTAYLALKLFAPEIETVTVDFDKIIPAVIARRVRRRPHHPRRPAYLRPRRPHQAHRPRRLVERANRSAAPSRWKRNPSLTRPEVQRITTNALRDSIQHALDHREAALEYAMQFARDLDPSMANRFVGMYVNERTLNYGDDGREAIRKLLQMGYDRGIISVKAKVDFVG